MEAAVSAGLRLRAQELWRRENTARLFVARHGEGRTKALENPFLSRRVYVYVRTS